MASLKEIRTRISSVKSTRQITSAMKMVSAAKLRKAQDTVLQMRPYAEKLQEILGNLSKSVNTDDGNVYGEVREIKKMLIVVVTSNKGLCGAFNANVVKHAIQLIKGEYADLYKAGKIDFMAIGKKGSEALIRHNLPVVNSNIDIFDNLTWENTLEIANSIMESFVTSKYDKIEVIYNQFKNAATQLVMQENFLPVKVEASGDESAHVAPYIFEPSKEYIVNQIIPNSLRVQFYKILLDSNASEHGARMTAMHKATDNATELVKDLNLHYNKARQAAITTEILEIVGGAEALKG